MRIGSTTGKDEPQRPATVVAARVFALGTFTNEDIRNSERNQPDATVFEVVRPDGFEPPTPWFEARYSIQLSYGRVAIKVPHYLVFAKNIVRSLIAFLVFQEKNR